MFLKNGEKFGIQSFFLYIITQSEANKKYLKKTKSSLFAELKIFDGNKTLFILHIVSFKLVY